MTTANVEAILIIMIVIGAVGVLAKIIRIPYTPFLVLTGTLASLWGIFPQVQFSPNLLFSLLLPPLLFEGAIRIPFGQLKKVLWGIFFLAVPGVLVSTLVLGPLFHLFFPFPAIVCFLFAALLAATDPVAVLDTLKHTSINIYLTRLIEGESLFNDGTAMVTYGIILGILNLGTWSLGGGLLDFLLKGIGGLCVGISLAALLTLVTRQINDHLIEMTLSTILAFGSYIIADSLSASGILAVIAAGLVYGNLGTKYGLSEEVKESLFDLWEYMAFLSNSVIFLLIGTQVNSRYIFGYWKPVLVAYLLLLIVRLFVVYLSFLSLRAMRKKLPLSWMWLTWWSGLRGALSLALAMSLPETIAVKKTLFFITLGLVLVFLFVNGLTAPALSRRLKLEPQKE